MLPAIDLTGAAVRDIIPIDDLRPTVEYRLRVAHNMLEEVSVVGGSRERCICP